MILDWQFSTNLPQNGRLEIDCIIDKAGTLFPVEIKAGQTIVQDYFNAIKAWNELTDTDPAHSYIIYGGDMLQHRSTGFVKSWQSSGHLINDKDFALSELIIALME